MIFNLIKTAYNNTALEFDSEEECSDAEQLLIDAGANNVYTVTGSIGPSLNVLVFIS